VSLGVGEIVPKSEGKNILKRVCVFICRANLFVGGTVNKRLHSISGEKLLQFSSCEHFLCNEQGSFGQRCCPF